MEMKASLEGAKQDCRDNNDFQPCQTVKLGRGCGWRVGVEEGGVVRGEGGGGGGGSSRNDMLPMHAHCRTQFVERERNRYPG